MWLCLLLFFFEGDAFVEFLGAFVAFGEEVDAHTTDVFLGAEGFGIVHFRAFYLEFHHAPVWQAARISSVSSWNVQLSDKNAMLQCV